MAVEEIHEWDQYPNESPEAWRAFNQFKRLPPHRRTVNEAWKLFNPDQAAIEPNASGTFSRWPKKFQWKIRAEAYDSYLEHLKDETKENAFSREQLEEREERKKLLKATKHFFVMFGHQLEKDAIEGTLQPNQLRALAAVMEIYNHESRIEYHDNGVKDDGPDQSETVEKLSKGIRTKIQQAISKQPRPEGVRKDPGIVQ